MHRTVRALITGTFVLACLGLWLLVTITARLYPPTLYAGDYPTATQWMLKGSPLLVIAAVAAVGYCAYSFKRADVDNKNILLGAVFALVISIFFIAIAFTILLPWIPHT